MIQMLNRSKLKIAIEKGIIFISSIDLQIIDQ